MISRKLGRAQQARSAAPQRGFRRGYGCCYLPSRQRIEKIRQFFRGADAPPGILDQASADHFVEAGRKRRICVRRTQRRRREQALADGGKSLPVKWTAAGGHFVEHHAKGE